MFNNIPDNNLILSQYATITSSSSLKRSNPSVNVNHPSSCLQNHQQTSQNSSHHQCSKCDKYFATNHYLKVHEKSAHSTEKPFQCHICGRKFSQRPGFTYHMRSVHTGEKRYSCRICGKSFIQLGTIKRHVETHQEVKAALMAMTASNAALTGLANTGSNGYNNSIDATLESFICKLNCTSDAVLLDTNRQELAKLKTQQIKIDHNNLEPGQIPNNFVQQMMMGPSQLGNSTTIADPSQNLSPKRAKTQQTQQNATTQPMTNYVLQKISTTTTDQSEQEEMSSDNININSESSSSSESMFVDIESIDLDHVKKFKVACSRRNSDVSQFSISTNEFMDF